jgi:hypothetical protein
VQAIAFCGAYPDAPVREIWKARRIKRDFDDLLDQAAS